MGNKQCAKLAERLWASVNQPKTDYSRKNFINSAFTSTQRNAIKTTNVVNNNNIYSGTMGGKNTSDSFSQNQKSIRQMRQQAMDL